MIVALILVIFGMEVRAITNDGSCKDIKDMLHQYLRGYLSPSLGAYQVHALRREFKTFTKQIEKSVKGI